MYTDKNNPYGGELSHTINFIDSNELSLDITRLVIEFNIYENIFNQTMSADFVIRDSLGLIDTPMTGQEFIQVLFDSKESTLVGNSQNLTFKVYKASDKTEVTAGTSVYILHCSSIELELNLTNKVITSYNDKLGSEIVQHIFDNYINEDNDKYIEIEECENVVPYAAAGHKPFEAIDIIGKECRSAKYGDASHFLFYETTQGFHFRTLSSLLEQAPDPDKNYFLGEPSVERNRTNVERTVVGHTFLDTVDSIDLLMKGFYQNSISAIDPLTKTFSETEFNYANQFDELPHITDGGKPMLNLSADKILAGNIKGSSHGRMVVADLAKQNERNNPTFDSRITANNDPFTFHGRERYRKTPKVVTQLASLRQHGIDITVPVNLNMNAGDIVQLFIPFTQDNENEHLPFIGHYGNNPTFLVTSVVTKFTPNGDYLTAMQCVKESFATDLRGSEVLSTLMGGTIAGKAVDFITQMVNLTASTSDAHVNVLTGVSTPALESAAATLTAISDKAKEDATKKVTDAAAAEADPSAAGAADVVTDATALGTAQSDTLDAATDEIAAKSEELAKEAVKNITDTAIATGVALATSKIMSSINVSPAKLAKVIAVIKLLEKIPIFKGPITNIKGEIAGAKEAVQDGISGGGD